MTYTLTGRYALGDLDGRDGEHLRFTPSTTVVGPDVIVLPAPVPVTLDSSGGFSVALVGTDDRDYAPTGWVWTVQELMDGGRPPWSFELTADADLSEVTQVVPPEDYELFTLTVADVITGAPGTDADVIITGQAPAQELTFTIPRGDVGATGATGATGDTGAQGLAARDTTFAAVHASMLASRSCAIQILSTSTANETTDWVYRFAQAIAADHPEWSVHHRLWSDATQDYAATTVIQTGTAGERMTDWTTGTGSRAMPASASPYLSGVIDVRLKMSMTDWTPAAQANVVGKTLSPTARGWYAIIDTSGYARMAYSVDGAAVATIAGTTATGIADGATSWVRWVFTPDNGAGGRSFSAYKGTDGVTWTQIGTTTTTAGAVTLFDNTLATYEVSGTNTYVQAGVKVYEVQIRDGLNGPIVAPILPELWPPYAATTGVRVTGAPILTIMNGAQPGATMAYLGDATRLKKSMPECGQTVTLLAASHNEGLSMGRTYVTALAAWRTAVEAQIGGVPLILCPENPQTSAATGYREHAARRIDLLAYAQRLGVPTLDVFNAFTETPNWETALMSDTVHPNNTGSDMWRDIAKASFDNSAPA